MNQGLVPGKRGLTLSVHLWVTAGAAAERGFGLMGLCSLDGVRFISSSGANR